MQLCDAIEHGLPTVLTLMNPANDSNGARDGLPISLADFMGIPISRGL